ncbi:MAG: hypothetical protein LBU22_11260 [Dysgonamonadaceae bacterium]|jgi:hypothetical protein|nr:hypothetical protein [Dysgonamonadaceae bacterium]
MKQTFIYKEKFAFSYCYPAIVFIVLAVLSWFFKYGIAFKNLRLLAYPNSMYILAFCAVLFIVYAFYKYSSAKASSKNPNPIEAEDNGITFPQGKDKRIWVAFTDVKELWHKDDEDEGKQVIIYTNNNDRYEFSEDRFASAAEFAAFAEIMNANCTNITNR